MVQPAHRNGEAQAQLGDQLFDAAMYFHAINPRWCGSLEKMQSFLIETIASIPTNQDLAYLGGCVIYERAEAMRVMASRPNHEGALPLYSQALTYGDHSSYRLGRANALMKRRLYPEAIVDLEAGIQDRLTYYELHR